MEIKFPRYDFPLCTYIGVLANFSKGLAIFAGEIFRQRQRKTAYLYAPVPTWPNSNELIVDPT